MMRPFWLVGIGAIALCACQSDPTDSRPGDGAGAAAPGGGMAVGILSDFAAGSEIERLRVVITEDGRTVRDDVFAAGSSSLPLVFPLEIPSRWIPWDAPFEVRLEAFAPGSSVPLLTRVAKTKGPFKLDHVLRVRLERECIAGTSLMGELVTPSCEAPLTCAGALCVDPYAPPETLDEYSETWATPPPDPCAPTEAADAAEPFVEFGQGEDGVYAPLAEDGTILVHGGLQGGFHMFVGVRVKNLHWEHPRLAFSMTDEEGASVTCITPSFLEPFGDGSCINAGLRCILPYESPPGLTTAEKIDAIKGTPYRIDVRAYDMMGDLAVTSRWVTISENISVDD